MAYNLPPPWDSGFALPQNVRNEGLERRGIITKEMPRGTYTMPKVGTGGYAVPDYVMKEGYGQGTYTSKWLPPGTYTTPAIPTWLNDRPQVVSDTKLPGGGRVVDIARPYSAQNQIQASVGDLLDDITSSPLAIAAIGGLAYFLLTKKKGRR